MSNLSSSVANWLLHFNPIWPKGEGKAHCAVPVAYLHVSVQYANERVEKTFLSYEFGKGQHTFYPVKLTRFLEEKK